MRKLILIAAAAAALVCGANTYNMSLGSFALEDANSCDWNISLGAASMMGATNVDRSVFLGNRAGQNTLSATNVVGIGWNAARNLDGTTRATDVNGQFKADETRDTVEIYSDTSAQPRMRYGNGTWTLDGDLIVSGRVAVSNRTVVAEEGTPTGYDFYVDAEYGDDENDGLSAITPKQTLDGALNLVTNNGARVCVRAGTYDYPEFFKKGLTYDYPRTPYCVNLYGVDGADRTLVVNSDTNAPAWVTGYEYQMASIHGFTFRGFNGPANGYGINSTFVFLYLRNCVFEDTDTKVGRYHLQEAIFEQCIMENCIVRNCKFSAVKNNGRGGQDGYYYTIVFMGDLMYNCSVEYTSPETLTDDNWTAMFSVATEWRDCYARIDKARLRPRRTWNGWNSDFADGNLYNSTIIIGELTRTYSSSYPYYYDDILGIDYGGNRFTNCYTNTPSYVADILGNDHRPLPQYARTIPMLGCCGYGAADSILTKNSIVAYVSQAITDSIPSGAAEGVRSALLLTANRLSANAEQTVPTRPNIEYLVSTATFTDMESIPKEEQED